MLITGFLVAALAKVNGSDPSKKEPVDMGDVYGWLFALAVFGIMAVVATKWCNTSPTVLSLVLSFLFPEIILPITAVKVWRTWGRPTYEQSCAFEPLQRLGVWKA